MNLTRVAGQLKCGELGPRILLLLQESLKHTRCRNHRKKQTLSRFYINRQVAEVKRMIKWACAHEYIPAEIYSKMLPVSGLRRGCGVREADGVQPIELTEVRLTLPFLNEPIRTMVVVQYLCAMRPSEVCGMRSEWIDRSKTPWLYAPVDHKNTHRGQYLRKAIPQKAAQLLEPFLEAKRSEYVFPACNRAGVVLGPYAVSSLRNAIKRAIHKANQAGVKVREWSPLQLRHTVATQIEEQFGREAAQIYLGHSELDTTAIYAQRSAKAVAELAKHFEATIFQNLWD
ncbi:tyrosine-type recombinase/integrase [Planctomicrobium sp. SH661]|uniref:tyrosine-type recombinase/integrase n=1 Tax=Planctomicrobium sp. SH661 TaxID=3448124 RepID=UPI003F5B3F4F